MFYFTFMRVLKHQSNYLQLKAKKSKDEGLGLIGLGVLGGLVSIILRATFAFVPLAILSIILVIFGLSSLQGYENYSRGLKGEDLVSQSLMNLNDEYYLISDIRFSDNFGNIDHIVLGPNGVFVIETKNYRGVIECVGDEWGKFYEEARYQKYYETRSPSKQVKRNAIRVKQIIDSANILDRSINLWVDGIVVFVDPTVILKLSNPTVPILRSNQLCDYIINKPTKITFSPQELKKVALSIINQSLV
jgi:hypothetical protein